MKNELIQIDLLKEKNNIVQQIETLQKDLQAIERLLEKYKNEDQVVMYEDDILTEPDSISEAVVKLFDNYPDRVWKSREIASRIQNLIKENKITTNTTNVPVSTRSAIKNLVNKKYIIKIPVMGGMRYKKA